MLADIGTVSVLSDGRHVPNIRNITTISNCQAAAETNISWNLIELHFLTSPAPPPSIQELSAINVFTESGTLRWKLVTVATEKNQVN